MFGKGRCFGMGFMKDFFGTGFYGKQEIVSHHAVCDVCRKLTVLSSYRTGRFLNLLQFPLIPLGKIRILDECSHSGEHGMTSNRKYRKLRAKDLAGMMEGFSSDADNPDTALNGLHTLMVYNEESWFMDLEQSYGRRFETHMQVQLVIAQGFCRFGHYAKAETYCRKAIILGAGPRAEELLALCQSLREKKDPERMATHSLRPESMWRPYAFVMAVTACLLIALVANGISAMRNHTAWLVSGAPKPCSVEIDGNLYRLRPYELKRIKLRLGKHQMQTHGLLGHTTPILFNYKMSILKQKFGDHVLVLNPDAIAVMVEETLFEGQTTNRYLFGKVINALENIDYPFSGFPVWVGSKHSARSRLFNHVPGSHVEMVEFLRAHGDPGDAAMYARRVLMIDPSGAEMENLIKIATSDLTTDQVLAFLQHGKSVLPPLPAWHCFYQSFMETRRPEHDLQTEYAMLCKSHPDMPGYCYLLGRVARNRNTARLLFEKSEKGTGSHGLGYHAIAYDLLCSGQFKEALLFCEKAAEQSPDNPEFKELDKQVHLALRHYDHLLRQVQNNLESDPGNGEWVAEKIKYLTLIGEHKLAIEAMESFPDPGGRWNAYFYAARFYAVGNATDYLENLLASGRGNAPLQRLLRTGEIEAAHNLLSKNEDHEYTAHLILYCAASHHGYPGIAETELAKAIAELGKSTLAQREATSILSSETPPSIKQLLDLRILPEEKAILCTSLGFKFPAHRKSFFNLSLKFNHTLEYPQLLLKKWTRETALSQ